MKFLRVAYRRVLGFAGWGVNREEIDAELQSHIDMACDENMRAGMSAVEARRQACLQLGAYEAIRQEYTDRTTLPWLEALVDDLRLAVRQLRKSPGFASVAAGVFGLSLAAALVVFAFVDAALVRPLPYQNPGRLVALFEQLPSGDRFHLSYADFQDWRQRNRTLAEMGVYRPDRFLLAMATGPESVRGATVSSGFFTTLGVQPMLGSNFLREDDGPGGERKVLLSYPVWVQRYGADRKLLGRSIQLDKQAYRVVGILPESFHFAAMPSPDFWKTVNGYCAENSSCYPFYGVGRLREGVPLELVRQDLVAIAGRIAAERPGSNRDRTAAVVPLELLLVGKVKPILLALLAGAALLMLVGLVNVFTLLLIRAERRRHETATRNALGATRTRLLRQFLVEGFLFAGLGGTLSLMLAFLSTEACRKQISPTTLERMPYLWALHVSPHVVWLAGAVTVLAALLFSAASLPTLHAKRLLQGLAEGGRSGTNRNWRKLGAALSVAQLSLTVVLLMSAGLLLESTRQFLHQDLGLTVERLSLLHVQAQGDLSDAKTMGLVQEVLARVRSLPGVQSADVSQSPPLNGTESFRMRFTHYKVVGKEYADLGNEAANQVVSPGYFQTLQMRLLHGRFFSATDRPNQRRVAIVNEATVRENFSMGENPIGRQIVSHYDPSHPLEIVGVVGNAKEGSLDAAVAPAVYQPYEQAPDSDFYVVMRSYGREQSVLEAATSRIRQINGEVIADGGRTMDREIRTSEPARLHEASAWIAAASAALALVLAAAGLYGVIAYAAGQRTREIGIRMALGAQRSSIYRMILGEAAVLMFVGLLFGIVASLATTHLLHSMMFHVAPWDPKILLPVVLALALATFAASFFPAHRAAFLEPTDSLRAL